MAIIQQQLRDICVFAAFIQVLDREIRDTYELTVSATDNSGDSVAQGGGGGGSRSGGGIEQQERLTGTAKVIVTVLDANDSPLQFPSLSPIQVGPHALVH